MILVEGVLPRAGLEPQPCPFTWTKTAEEIVQSLAKYLARIRRLRAALRPRQDRRPPLKVRRDVHAAADRGRAERAEGVRGSVIPNGRCVATGNLTSPGVDGVPGNDHAEWHEGEWGFL